MKKAEVTVDAASAIEKAVRDFDRRLHFDELLTDYLNTTDKLYLISTYVVASLDVGVVQPLSKSEVTNKAEVLDVIGHMLAYKKCNESVQSLLLGKFSEVLDKVEGLVFTDGEDLRVAVYNLVNKEIIPYIGDTIDYAAILLNSLNDWVSIENDKENDVVFTPDYVADLMCKLARVNKDSYVVDKTMGSGGLLIAGIRTMQKDAEEKIEDSRELFYKLIDIRDKQVLGIEYLDNVYVLTLLNALIMGNFTNNLMLGDSHALTLPSSFPCNALLLNPPYSAPGKGLIFAEECMNQMKSGYAVVLIQDSAGNGHGLPHAKNILKNNTLEASIKMPSKLFGSKASVGVCIFVFKVNEPHKEDKEVLFIDFSDDGYLRQSRKRASKETNLKNKDHAIERYEEIVDIVLGRETKTGYYKDKVIRDTITLDGTDWGYAKHQVIDMRPTEADFKRTVSDYLSFKVSQLMKGGL